MCECVGYWIDKSVVPGTLKVIQSPPLGAQGHVPEAPGLPLFQPARFLAMAPSLLCTLKVNGPPPAPC